jgi:hypothetical protein
LVGLFLITGVIVTLGRTGGELDSPSSFNIKQNYKNILITDYQTISE